MSKHVIVLSAIALLAGAAQAQVRITEWAY
jgi:hypothetical protein